MAKHKLSFKEMEELKKENDIRALSADIFSAIYDTRCVVTDVADELAKEVSLVLYNHGYRKMETI